ncbi:hypothetical protein LTR09_005769 [Extremus antarcticus]|uniref:Uncharacterized protein n=1 Tax=Extremus antarcticus TaxID=702011 RepID=A0AAJ0DND7_9PEZI|nr:hypothetical protein LTR09_005769 [Extremus antarcticus]
MTDGPLEHTVPPTTPTPDLWFNSTFRALAHFILNDAGPWILPTVQDIPTHEDIVDALATAAQYVIDACLAGTSTLEAEAMYARWKPVRANEGSSRELPMWVLRILVADVLFDAKKCREGRHL